MTEARRRTQMMGWILVSLLPSGAANGVMRAMLSVLRRAQR